MLLAEKAQEDVEQRAKDICSVLDRALSDFDQMRAREGERLKEDVLSRAARIEELVTLVEERSPQTVSEYRAKLEARMNEVLTNTQLDPARILTEAAIFADKVAVDEETVRLRSHISQLREMLGQGAPPDESWTSSFRSSTGRPTPSAPSAVTSRSPAMWWTSRRRSRRSGSRCKTLNKGVRA